MNFSVGDKVRYTPTGIKATRPLDPKAIGEVVEAEDYEIVVRWPCGLAAEDERHIRKVKQT